MSDTPRTDAITQDATLDANQEALSLAALARAIERELTACKLDLGAEERGQDNLRSLLDAKSAECQRLREALEPFSKLDRNVNSELWAIRPELCEAARAALQETQP